MCVWGGEQGVWCWEGDRGVGLGKGQGCGLGRGQQVWLGRGLEGSVGLGREQGGVMGGSTTTYPPASHLVEEPHIVAHSHQVWGSQY